MTDIFNIEDEPIFDDRKIETHSYNPFANTTFGYSDEIRIFNTTAIFIYVEVIAI